MAELGALPEQREARSREERLGSEMAGLERSIQYMTADLSSAASAMAQPKPKCSYRYLSIACPAMLPAEGAARST